MTQQRWLITGASGQLGGHVVRRLASEGGDHTILALVRRRAVRVPGAEVSPIDFADAGALRACVTAFRPTHVLHLAAMTVVGDCYARPAHAEAVNVRATRALAETTNTVGARLVFTSTDMVFAGDAAPYTESDPPRPLSCYGRTKAAAERWVTDLDGMLVVRLPLMYGLPCSRRETTFARQLAALRQRQPLRLFTDEFRTPVWLVDVARAVIGLARGGVEGVLHLAGPERLSRYELLARCAKLLSIDQPNLVPILQRDVATDEPRPKDLSLASNRLANLSPVLVPGPVRPEVFATG